MNDKEFRELMVAEVERWTTEYQKFISRRMLLELAPIKDLISGKTKTVHMPLFDNDKELLITLEKRS